MEFRCGRMLLEIDERTGSIVRIVDTRSGLVHLDAPADGRLFRLQAPTEAWSSNYIESRDQRPPRVERSGTALTLHWEDMRDAQGASTGVDARVDIDARGDEVRFTLALANRGDRDMLDVQFPIVAGWTGIGGKGRDQMSVGGNWSYFDPHQFPLNKGTTYARVHQRAAYGYPVNLYAPWVDLSGPGGGLSYLHYMREPQNGFVGVENLAGYGPGLRLSFGWITPTVVAPGERWATPPIGLALHTGDWHDTADRYRGWMAEWFTPPPTSERLRASIGFQNVFLRGFDGAPFRPLDSIPAIAAAGRKYGVHDLCIWDFLSNGNYAKRADRDLLDYTPEERAALQAALRQARAEGTNVNALINFRLLNPAQSLFMREGYQEIVRSYDGTPRMESYPGNHEAPHFWSGHLGPNCYLASPFAPSYRARVLRQTQEYLDLGYVSMFYDQPFEVMPDYGQRGLGCRPEETYAAVNSLVAEVGALLRAADPEAYLIGEFAEVFMSRHIDLWMSWYTDVEHLIRARYTVPQTLQSWVVDSNPAQASHAFALGAYLCLCTHGNEATLDDEPAFGAHVAALAALRARTAPRTVGARFNDRCGISVEGGPGFVAYAFDSATGPLVIAAATDGACAGAVTVQREAFAVPGGDEGVVHHLDGTAERVSGDVRAFRLPEHGVAVWAL